MVELSDKTLHHYRNTPPTKTCLLEENTGTTCFSFLQQSDRDIFHATHCSLAFHVSGSEQHKGQRGVSPSLTVWETIEPNKWSSSCTHHLMLWLGHPRLFLRSRAHPAKISCRSGGVQCTFPVGDNTGLNKWLVNQRRNVIKKEQSKEKAWEFITVMVQRSGGLWLTSLLWRANEGAAAEKIRRNESEERILHRPAVFWLFYFTITLSTIW